MASPTMSPKSIGEFKIDNIDIFQSSDDITMIQQPESEGYDIRDSSTDLTGGNYLSNAVQRDRIMQAWRLVQYLNTSDMRFKFFVKVVEPSHLLSIKKLCEIYQKIIYIPTYDKLERDISHSANASKRSTTTGDFSDQKSAAPRRCESCGPSSFGKQICD